MKQSQSVENKVCEGESSPDIYYILIFHALTLMAMSWHGMLWYGMDIQTRKDMDLAPHTPPG
jgi:hypothetical protein